MLCKLTHNETGRVDWTFNRMPVPMENRESGALLA